MRKKNNYLIMYFQLKTVSIRKVLKARCSGTIALFCLFFVYLHAIGFMFVYFLITHVFYMEVVLLVRAYTARRRGGIDVRRRERKRRNTSSYCNYKD